MKRVFFILGLICFFFAPFSQDSVMILAVKLLALSFLYFSMKGSIKNFSGSYFVFGFLYLIFDGTFGIVFHFSELGSFSIAFRSLILESQMNLFWGVLLWVFLSSLFNITMIGFVIHCIMNNGVNEKKDIVIKKSFVCNSVLKILLFFMSMFAMIVFSEKNVIIGNLECFTINFVQLNLCIVFFIITLFYVLSSIVLFFQLINAFIRAESQRDDCMGDS